MEAWAQTHYIQLILDFLAAVVRKPIVLIGNFVGGLACVIATLGMLGCKENSCS
ncbi:hypothetical protein Patl1_35170 [Pistacia atlantica]|uniref:Uncharacterized protein n=1 Tax=Pistacia atlantica TaxID=434234 RepID=A0ACC0ZSS9_9ROSI|nr:hypothetical protein Patl1_35170 [Pistacia atlantica]